MSRELQDFVTDLHFSESPRWHDNRLFFSDFYDHKVFSVAEDGSDQRVEAEVPTQPSGLGWLPDGRLLIVSMSNRQILRRETDGTLVTHSDLSKLTPNYLNDMVVDARGTCYVGNFGFDLGNGAPLAPADLIKVDADGTASIVASDMYFPNGSVVVNDNKTLIVSESFGNRMSAFDIAAADGTLSNRRFYAQNGGLPESHDLAVVAKEARFSPDGICCDAEGCLWVADFAGERIARIKEGGEVVDEIKMKEGNVFACMLGGKDGKTLYACVGPDYHPDARMKVRECKIVQTRVEVPHAGYP